MADSQTRLEWQRLVPASYAPACSSQSSAGSPVGDICSAVEARSYCATLALAGGGWRLPTKAELESLIDESRYNPAIDTSAFPSTPPEMFLTGSPSAATPSLVWRVYFQNGTSYNGPALPSGRVRCVR